MVQISWIILTIFCGTLFIVGGVVGAISMAYLFARDQSIVRIKEEEVILKKEFFQGLMKRARMPNEDGGDEDDNDQ